MLDNPIWHALVTEQTRFAVRAGGAARFAPEVTALVGLETASAIGELAPLIAHGELVGLLADVPPAQLPAHLALVDRTPVLQMIHAGPAPRGEPLEVLGPADHAAMLALAETTRPGPFGTRTPELGTFLGIRADGRLVAMAGQRMRLPGLVELSAICTDPAHVGRGHAARLVAAQLALVVGGGTGAFLHVRADNARAIALYERHGFATRREFHYLVLRGA